MKTVQAVIGLVATAALAGGGGFWLGRSSAPQPPPVAFPVCPPAEPCAEAEAEEEREPPPPIEQLVAPGAAVAKPHVVLVVGCTLRWDQLPVYGGLPEAAPFMGQMGSLGTVFDAAYSAAPWTKAASTALMTGHHAITIGMTEPGAKSNRRRIAPEVTTLAEHMKSAGYGTIGLTANPNTNEVFGFRQGFDTYFEATNLWRDGMTKVNGRRMVEEALAAIDARPDTKSPLYLRLMMIDTHDPIKASKKDAALLRDEDGKTPVRVAKYRVALSRFDRAISELWGALGDRGMDESNTILVVVSDHGEGLAYPKHHGPGHGNLTYSSTVTMPWLMYGAGIAPAHRVAGVASQVDVLPTLVELAGGEGYEGPGHSWAAAVRGEVDRTTRTRAWVDTWFQSASRVAVYTTRNACHKDYRSEEEWNRKERILEREMCYDHAADPYGQEPLASLDQGLMAEVAAWRRAAVEEARAWAFTQDAEVSDDVNAQLRALGYLGDEESPTEDTAAPGTPSATP
jgi:arylsulfatase A-like enzyme